MSAENVFQIVNLLDGDCYFPEENLKFQKGDTFLITAKGISEKISIGSKTGVTLALMGVGSDWVSFVD